MYKEALSKIPLVGGILGSRGPIKGDVKRDVILAKSHFRHNVFVCVNKLDFEDEFFNHVSSINKLFGMGWGGIISCDEANKLVYFCVPEFKGMCYAVSYNYLFSTLGSTAYKSFSDLNDVKKSTGGIFKRKVDRKRLFKNEIYNKYIDSDVKYFSEIEKKIITESKSFDVKKETMELNRNMKNYVSALKTGDVNKVKASLKRNTKYKNADEIKRKLNKEIPTFKKGYDITKSEISPNIKSLKNISISQGLLTLICIFGGAYSIKDYIEGKQDEMENTKKFAKKLNKKIAKNKVKVEKKYNEEDNNEKDIDDDYILGLSFIITLTAVVLPFISYLIYISTIKYNILQNLFGSVVHIISTLGEAIFGILGLAWFMIDSVVVPVVSGFAWVFELITSILPGG
jgi:hypothetical protein